MGSLYNALSTQIAVPMSTAVHNIRGGTEGIPPIGKVMKRPTRKVMEQLLLSTATVFLIHDSTPTYQPETAQVFIESIAKEQRLDSRRTDIQMLTRIRQLAVYPHGWDGANGKAPSQAAVRDAECFTRILVHDDVYAPSISLATDGEINFFWMLRHFRLDLGFYGDGTYSYYGTTTAGDEFLADDIPVSTPLPIQILQLIRKQ